MEIEVIRNTFTDKSTIGEILIDGVHECFSLEDRDRGLSDNWPIEQINKFKVFGLTCIPYGRYKVIVTKSERFSNMAGHDVYLPFLLNVKGFDGVRIHSGNRPEDTEGCILVGTDKGIDVINNSRTAFVKINDRINQALKNEDVWITIKKSGL